MEKKTKAETFIGFAMRAGKYKIGMNAIATLKRAELIIVCKSISENSLKDAVKLSKRFHCSIIKTQLKDLAEITHKENSKVMAVTDKQLSVAILENKENEFTVVGDN